MFILYLPSPSDSLPYLIPQSPRTKAHRATCCHPTGSTHPPSPHAPHTPTGPQHLKGRVDSNSSLLWVGMRFSSCSRCARHSSATRLRATTTKLPGDVDRRMVPHRPHPNNLNLNIPNMAHFNSGEPWVPDFVLSLLKAPCQASSDPQNDLHPVHYPRLLAGARKRWAQEATMAPRPPPQRDLLTQTIQAYRS